MPVNSASRSLPPPRDDFATLLESMTRIAALFDSWDENHRAAALAYADAVESLHGAALRRLIGALKHDPAANAALKSAVADELVYAVLRRHNILKPSLNERVEAALASVRPMLASHGGDVALVNFAPPVVELQFTGSCDGCSASQLTFQAGVRKAVMEHCPEITDVRNVNGTAVSHGGFVSPFARDVGEWRDAGSLDDIPNESVRTLTLAGQKLIVSRQGVSIVCYDDACAHLGLPLGEGDVCDGVIVCPHHDFEYRLVDGACLTAPDLKLQAHPARVTEGRVEIRLSR